MSVVYTCRINTDDRMHICRERDGIEIRVTEDGRSSAIVLTGDGLHSLYEDLSRFINGDEE
jgi:hypothetical protein